MGSSYSSSSISQESKSTKLLIDKKQDQSLEINSDHILQQTLQEEQLDLCDNYYQEYEKQRYKIFKKMLGNSIKHKGKIGEIFQKMMPKYQAYTNNQNLNNLQTNSKLENNYIADNIILNFTQQKSKDAHKYEFITQLNPSCWNYKNLTLDFQNIYFSQKVDFYFLQEQISHIYEIQQQQQNILKKNHNQLQSNYPFVILLFSGFENSKNFIKILNTISEQAKNEEQLQNTVILTNSNIFVYDHDISQNFQNNIENQATQNENLKTLNQIQQEKYHQLAKKGQHLLNFKQQEQQLNLNKIHSLEIKIEENDINSESYYMEHEFDVKGSIFVSCQNLFKQIELLDEQQYLDEQLIIYKLNKIQYFLHKIQTSKCTAHFNNKSSEYNNEISKSFAQQWNKVAEKKIQLIIRNSNYIRSAQDLDDQSKQNFTDQWQQYLKKFIKFHQKSENNMYFIPLSIKTNMKIAQHMENGKYYQDALKQYLKSLSLFRNSYEQNPDYINILNSCANLYLTFDNNDQAYEALQNALKYKENSISLKLLLPIQAEKIFEFMDLKIKKFSNNKIENSDKILKIQINCLESLEILLNKIKQVEEKEIEELQKLQENQNEVYSNIYNKDTLRRRKSIYDIKKQNNILNYYIFDNRNYQIQQVNNKQSVLAQIIAEFFFHENQNYSSAQQYFRKSILYNEENESSLDQLMKVNQILEQQMKLMDQSRRKSLLVNQIN